jgi:hypothetical protein
MNGEDIYLKSIKKYDSLNSLFVVIIFKRLKSIIAYLNFLVLHNISRTNCVNEQGLPSSQKNAASIQQLDGSNEPASGLSDR